jgi:hypothetical protein
MTMASHRHNRPELSVIPDLRFEYSYLKSIGRYVRLERLGNNDSPSSRPWNQSSEEKLPELSVIPDLRFEYSYLKSIGRYVRLERFGNNNSPSSRLWNQSSEEKLLEDYENLELQDSATSPEEQSLTQPGLRSGEVMHIQWKNVIWFTIRDQIIAPFLQGALWYGVPFYRYFLPLLTTWLIGVLRAIILLPSPEIWDPN